jgi:putative glutamine amidotransferase
MTIRRAWLFALTACLLIVLVRPAPAAPTDRFFDTASEPHQGVRLAVFYPSPGSIRALAALFKRGLLDPADLTVVGVYHVKEATDYAESAKYVADNGLTWMKFHAVSAEIDPTALFRKNACTPEYETIVKKADGVIFFGGPDIPPAVYGKKTNLLAEIEDPYRHYFELSAVFHFLGGSQDPGFKPLLEARPGFPILGICLGFQTLNVGTGGSMIQDIWQEVYGKNFVEDAIALGPARWHNNPWARIRPELKLIPYNLHAIKLAANGPFVRDWGFAPAATPVVVSSHHQALDRIGQGLLVIATSLDGRIPEAVIHQTYRNVLGVQFHPEFPNLWDPDFRGRFTPDDPASTSLLSILEQKPPSLAFNKKIWSWLGAKLRESRGLK